MKFLIIYPHQRKSSSLNKSFLSSWIDEIPHLSPPKKVFPPKQKLFLKFNQWDSSSIIPKKAKGISQVQSMTFLMYPHQKKSSSLNKRFLSSSFHEIPQLSPPKKSSPLNKSFLSSSIHEIPHLSPPKKVFHNKQKVSFKFNPWNSSSFPTKKHFVPKQKVSLKFNPWNSSSINTDR